MQGSDTVGEKQRTGNADLDEIIDLLRKLEAEREAKIIDENELKNEEGANQLKKKESRREVKQEECKDVLTEEEWKNEQLPLGFSFLKTTITLPKVIIPFVDIMSVANDKIRDELLADLVAEKLQVLCDEPFRMPHYIGRIKEFWECLRVGINQYFGREEFEREIEEEVEMQETILPEHETIRIEMKMPKLMIDCILRFCKRINTPKEVFLAEVIMGRLMWLYQNQSFLMDYTKHGKKKFLEILQEAIHQYGKNRDLL